MDRFVAMLILCGAGILLVLLLLALFAAAPILCSILVSLCYTLFLFVAHEDAGVHHAQEFENRFWTIFALLSSTAILFAKDSPLCLGLWSPSLGFLAVIASGYAIHALDRHLHRLEISREHGLHPLRRSGTANSSLVRLNSLGGVPVEDQLTKITSCLREIDQIFIPSTINNFLNERYISKKEREIIAVFEEAEPRALNYIITHVKLGLVFYKVKDHRSFGGLHRTELIELLAVDRLSILNVLSRVVVLHALQIMKLPANTRSEFWVRNIILKTHLDDLSELKTLTDAKGNYFCMNKLLFTDIRTETIRRDILAHIKKEAAIQQAHMKMGSKRAKERSKRAWRKILSDVDDTLTCSGGSYPSGIDKRYGKKVTYPGVLSFYRELDLGCVGPEIWPPNTPGNLVFLSARTYEIIAHHIRLDSGLIFARRPHVYKDYSEKKTYHKFQKLRDRGLHTMPSLLAGDMASGSAFLLSDDMEPLAQKKFENFQKFASIYPEFSHVFIGDNGQGDVRAGELMYERFPNLLEALYIHIVGDIRKTHGYNPERWYKKGFRPCFFRTYPDAALDAATRKPPLIRMSGLKRVCEDAVRDFLSIQQKQWPSSEHLYSRREELNQGIYRANKTLINNTIEPVPLIPCVQSWKYGQLVTTPYGIGTVLSFDPIFDLYTVELDWRPLDVQNAEYKAYEAKIKSADTELSSVKGKRKNEIINVLETVVETSEIDEELGEGISAVDAPNTTSYVRNNDRTPQPNANHVHEHSAIDECKSTEDNETVASRTLSISSWTPSCTPVDFNSDFSIGGYHEDENETVALRTVSTTDSVSDAGSCSSLGALPSYSAENNSHELVNTSSDAVYSVKPCLTVKLENGSNRTNCWDRHQLKQSNRILVATVQGRFLRKFSMPKLPLLSKESEKRGTRFSFWATEQKPIDKEVKKPKYNAGQQVSTPYGLAVVKEDLGDIVVVKMHGFHAMGYINKSSVRAEGKNFLNVLLRQLSIKETQEPPTPKRKKIEAPIPVGTVLHTPFGKGVVQAKAMVGESDAYEQRYVERSLPLKVSGERDRPLTPIRKHNYRKEDPINIVAISLSAWPLRNGKHAILYSHIDNALKWKLIESEGKDLLSVFGSLVSKTMKRMSNATAVVSSGGAKPVLAPELKEFARYFKDGAAVTTMYGDGRVVGFRKSDGIYEVELTSWTLTNHRKGKAFCSKDSMCCRLAKGCHEGYPVLTSLGLTGTLNTVEPSTGIHVVTVQIGSMVCYLQPDNIICPLKAALGEKVVTSFGEGVIRKYRHKDMIYSVELTGCKAMMYARGEEFDRIENTNECREGPFEMNWFWRFLLFYNSGEKKVETPSANQRSRSNSVASRKSAKSHCSK